VSGKALIKTTKEGREGGKELQTKRGRRGGRRGVKTKGSCSGKKIASEEGTKGLKPRVRKASGAEFRSAETKSQGFKGEGRIRRRWGERSFEIVTEGWTLGKGQRLPPSNEKKGQGGGSNGRRGVGCRGVIKRRSWSALRSRNGRTEKGGEK
jgi:hypothetical protein